MVFCLLSTLFVLSLSFFRLPGRAARGPLPTERSSLREWWHSILRDHGRYPCYAILLANLPGDKQAAHYLAQFGVEIDLMSGDDCLVIVLGGTEIRLPDFDERAWEVAAYEHLSRGHSITVADLFGITYDDFPCLLLFNDIRSPEYIAVTFRDMAAHEIAAKMRAIFSRTRQAIADGEDPLAAIELARDQEIIREKGKTVFRGIGRIAEKGFQKAIEAWIETTIGQL